MEKVNCFLSRKNIDPSLARKGEELQNSLFDLIQKEHPDFTKDKYISIEELNVFRRKYLAGIVQAEVGELDNMENEVLDAIAHNKILSENIEDDIDDTLSFGQKMADKIAEFGGSWSFIMSFFGFMLVWIGINVWILTQKPFDPYPFILLNLILSCLASLQAPIIMMSQNRQEQKDRKRSEHDYKINLKAELEIKMLHEKMDHLMIHQNKRLLEIQEIQADYLEDILKVVKNTGEKK